MYTKIAIAVLSIVAASLINTDLRCWIAQREFDATMQEFKEPAPEQPGIRSELSRIATVIAPVAIDSSLIPYNLFDQVQTERRIRGNLLNILGVGWTVEVTCYAGWCNISLKHATGEIDIDADKGVVSKSVYLGNRRGYEELKREIHERMNAIAENLKEAAIIACMFDEAQAAQGRAELERAFAKFGSVEMHYEPGFCSITLKTGGGTIHAWALDGEGHTHVSSTIE